ncbi:hypothetical protein Vretimale_931 [Volvox reticuliferus]|uniref:Uncharacterized protein n=1 Tax=Volvox reticuliferus TaxID=1737510 RepID=A0A8J4FYT2_9CHLO|nr:hypothetical protein Vretimale_931 [Volvox reticuliferus]
MTIGSSEGKPAADGFATSFWRGGAGGMGNPGGDAGASAIGLRFTARTTLSRAPAKANTMSAIALRTASFQGSIGGEGLYRMTLSPASLPAGHATYNAQSSTCSALCTSLNAQQSSPAPSGVAAGNSAAAAGLPNPNQVELPTLDPDFFSLPFPPVTAPCAPRWPRSRSKPNMPAKSAARAHASCMKGRRINPCNQVTAPVPARLGDGGEAAASLTSCEDRDMNAVSRLGSKGRPARKASAWRSASRTWISTPTTSRRAWSILVLAPPCNCFCASAPGSLFPSVTATACSTKAWRASTDSAASSMCDIIVLRLYVHARYHQASVSRLGSGQGPPGLSGRACSDGAEPAASQLEHERGIRRAVAVANAYTCITL